MAIKKSTSRVQIAKALSGALCFALLSSSFALGNPPARQDEQPQSRPASQDTTPSLISKDNELSLSPEKPKRNNNLFPDKGVQPGSRGGGISEGRPLETVLWGGGGAIIGSIAGPLGTIVGASVGALIGLVVGTVMPRKQRSPTFRDSKENAI
jgi:hypothetical protein